MIFDNTGRNGILSLANARRDANLSRMGATDQYEADVADFINNEITDIENNFMSGGNTFEDPFNIQPPSMPPDDFQEQIFVPPIDNIFEDQIFVPPIDNIYEDIFIDDINLPPVRTPIDDLPPFIPPIDEPPLFIPPIDERPPFVPPIDIPNPPFVPPIDVPNPPRPPRDGPMPPFQPPFVPSEEPPFTPPEEPPYTPPTPTPPVEVSAPTRRAYRPPTDFDSGAPSIRLSPGISTRIFGQAPGFVTTPIKRPITKPPQVPPRKPPIRIPPPDDVLRPTGMKFGGRLNAGIMRLPQSQQGDTMTTRIFQNAFKPRR